MPCTLQGQYLRDDVLSGSCAGLVIPRIEDSGAAYIAVSLLGAVVMPHNLYLHSGSVLTRGATPPPGEEPARVSLMYNSVESALSLLVSLFVNVATVSVAAATVIKVRNAGMKRRAPGLSRGHAHRCRLTRCQHGAGG